MLIMEIEGIMLLPLNDLFLLKMKGIKDIIDIDNRDERDSALVNKQPISSKVERHTL